MKTYKNILTGVILTEEEYKELLIRECKEQWKDESNLLVSEFKEEGKNINDYIEYTLNTNIDSDFVIID